MISVSRIARVGEVDKLCSGETRPRPQIASQYLDTVSSAALERFAEARAVAAALVRSRDAYKTAREAAAGKSRLTLFE